MNIQLGLSIAVSKSHVWYFSWWYFCCVQFRHSASRNKRNLKIFNGIINIRRALHGTEHRQVFKPLGETYIQSDSFVLTDPGEYTSQRNPRRISPMNHWVKAVGIPPGAGLGLHPSGE